MSARRRNKKLAGYTEPVHPVTNQPLTDLDRTILRLRFVALEAHLCLRAISRPVVNEVQGDLVRNGDLLFSLTNHGLLLVHKFLEIWGSLGDAGKDKRMIAAKRAIDPLVDRIKIWPGIADFRGDVLAHAYLTLDQKFIHPAYHMGTQRAPTQAAEVVVLLECVSFGVIGVLATFQKEYDELKPLTQHSGQQPTTTRGITSGTRLRDELRPLAKALDKNLQDDVGLTLKESVFKEFFDILEAPAKP